MGGRIFCAGYGSLVHKEWAQASVPNLADFSLFKLKNYRRVFGKVHPFCIYRNEANWGTREVAACFIEPAEGHGLIVSGFSILSAEWPALRLRECDYGVKTVTLEPLAGGCAIEAKIFIGYPSDHQMPQTLDETYSHWPWMRQKYQGEIYRHDIYPSRAYLQRCLQAYAMQGEGALDNFLDHSFLADRQTTLRTHLERIAPKLIDLGTNGGTFRLPNMPPNES